MARPVGASRFSGIAVFGEVEMSRRIDKSSRNARETYEGKHRYEHWYVDNQVYFITARCRDGFHAFATEEAQQVFWTKLEQYCKQFGFELWVASLMVNHYHLLGHLKVGLDLKVLMQRLHGSVAKLVNELLPERRSEFWRDTKGEEYFDGCIRDEKQCRLSFRYTLTQARRHGIMQDYTQYPGTRVYVDLENAVRRALAREAFLAGVPYKRYQRRG